jgi:hypothetical protein
LTITCTGYPKIQTELYCASLFVGTVSICTDY